ncbi:hypothetical protein [Algoriphagus sp. Y33]|uniref:hypothetical protein n=1 Tax=Algoriphagus sp. Y33 TaxID=2772483 RepID=UPI0017871686|nr:hypothetical protein [Algoriphagus sp. Y33]
MINYFRKIITGYKRRERIVDGEPATFYYVGQMVMFSPVSMLRDLVLKKQTADFAIRTLEIDPLQIQTNIWPLSGKVAAKTKVIMECGSSVLKVYRYAAKLDDVNVSHYEFYVDNEIAAIFHRKYDYGRTFNTTAGKIHQKLNSIILKTDEKHLFTDIASDTQLILEFFGHTQAWIIFKEDALREIVEYWDLQLRK